MGGEAVRIAGRCLGLALTVGAATGALAQTTQTGMVVSASVDAATNPYNGANSPGASLAANVDARPELRWRDATTTLDITGDAQLRQFLRYYGLEQNYALNAGLQTRASDRLQVHISSNFSYQEGGYGGLGLQTAGVIAPAIGATAPDPLAVVNPLVVDPQLLLVADATVLGRRIKSTSFGSGAGIAAQLNGRSQLTADVNARGVRYGTGGFSDYNNYGGELGYSRTLTDQTSIGLVGDVSWSDYIGKRIGDALVVDGLASFDRRLNARWTLSLSAGLSFTDIKQLAGQPDFHGTSFTVRGRFCWQAERSQLCVNGQRSPQPTALGSVRVSTTVGANYSRRLTERESVTVSGTYSRTGGSLGAAGANFDAVTFLQGSARYSNQVRDRLSMFVSADVSKSNAFRSARPNFGASLGVQYGFGALR